MNAGSYNARRRKRVSRACDRCRRKREKCDGRRPTCASCQSSGQFCAYGPCTKKRGLPEGYVRGLEKLWALSICNIDGFEDTILSMLGKTADSAGRHCNLMSAWVEKENSESLHMLWKSSRLFKELERILSASKLPCATEDQPSRSIDDQLDSQSCIEVTEEAVPGVSTVPRLTIQSGLLRGPQPAQEIASQYVSAEVSAAPVRLMSQTSQLLKNYFTLTHSWFPVVSKSSILRTSFTLDHIPGTVETKSPASGDHAALWATLSYSITQYGVETGIEHTRAMSLAEKYSTEAQNLIPFELERCELGHIQALLLLALVDMNMQAWEPAWLLIGQAIRMAFTIGLGSSSDIRRYDKPEQGKATLFGCYVLDSLLSYRLLKCPRMSPIDLAQVGLLEEDGQEDWTSGVKSPSPREPLLAIGCFNHLVQLANILNRLAPKLLMGHNGETVARQLLMDLEQWDANLPIGCRLMGPENMYLERNSSTLPHQTYLSLAYIATLLWSYSRLIPGEKGLHPWLQPATQGAKRLLCRGLSMITQHLENFPKSGIPPIFEFSLHTIAEKAFSLCDTANPSDTSLFVEWIETFMQKVILLVPTWSPHASLMSTTESCQKSVGSSTGQISAFSSNIDHPNLSRESSLIMEPRGDFIDVLPKPHGGSIDRPDILTLQPPVQQVITLNMAALQSEPASISLQGLIKPQLRKTGIFTPNVMSAGNDPGIEPSTIIDDGMADNHDCKEYPDAFLGDLAYPNAIGWSKSRESGIDDFESLGNSTFHESSHSQDSSFELQNVSQHHPITQPWPDSNPFAGTFQCEAPIGR